MNRYYKTVTTLSVRPSDLDGAGHVHNARALEYLEQGRWNWLYKNGLSRRNMIIPVVVRIEVDYEIEIPLTDVRIETHLSKQDNAIYKAIFQQTIYIGTSKNAAVEASVHVAFIDSEDRGVCAMTDFIEDANVTQ